MHTQGQKPNSATTARVLRSLPEEAAKLDPTIAAGETAKETRKKRITKFAWGDGKKSVSVYVDFEGVKEDAVSIDWEARRVAVTIRGSADGENDHELILEPLHDDIRDVKVRSQAEQKSCSC